MSLLGLLCLFAPVRLPAQTPVLAADAESLRLRPVKVLGANANSKSKAETKPALVLNAKRLSIQLDQKSQAEGDAELRYGDLLMRAQQINYGMADDLVQARG
ncbi:hypothetical protein ACVBEH_25480, partial [Roseateles sp. GG27B]